jgi:guanylate kinase
MKLVSITGPSCAGKTTLAREILKDSHFCEVISFTSRSPRTDEMNGKDYYFLTREKCQQIIDANAAAEHIEFKGNIYGIEREEIETKISLGKIPLVIVEPHGLQQLNNVYGAELYSVYLDAPIELLYERFLDRFSKEVSYYSQDWSTKILDLKYHASRIKGISEERESWVEECDWNFYIDRFTSDNKKSIVDSLVETLLKR